MSAAAGIGPKNSAQGVTSSIEAFPWDAVLHAGLCLLRLPPAIFWTLTPVEFFAMTGGMKLRDIDMGMAGLEALMQAFPDG